MGRVNHQIYRITGFCVFKNVSRVLCGLGREEPFGKALIADTLRKSFIVYIALKCKRIIGKELLVILVFVCLFNLTDSSLEACFILGIGGELIGNLLGGGHGFFCCRRGAGFFIFNGLGIDHIGSEGYRCVIDCIFIVFRSNLLCGVALRKFVGLRLLNKLSQLIFFKNLLENAYGHTFVHTCTKIRRKRIVVFLCARFHLLNCGVNRGIIFFAQGKTKLFGLLDTSLGILKSLLCGIIKIIGPHRGLILREAFDIAEVA